MGEALRFLWADFPRAGEDDGTALFAWLSDMCRAEQRLAAQLARDATRMPYADFSRRLEEMARQDAQHAHLLQKRIGAVASPRVEDALSRGRQAVHLEPGLPWRWLQRVLAEKRELYERYRQQAHATEDVELRELLLRLAREEEDHQAQVVELLVKLDSHRPSR